MPSFDDRRQTHPGLRAELGVGLTEAKAVAGQVLAGAYSGTLPEVEYLARKLRGAGVDAVAARP
ncbi:hypothetical protein [Streptomyces nigrescens]|uniref:hypothetical protein n=1 Tax=Streptomyces nigrescens TaxID=1920 RepID=UPI0036B85A70